MHIRQILQGLLDTISIGNTPEVTESMLALSDPIIKPQETNGIGFVLEFENGWYIGLKEFRGTMFGVLRYGDGARYSGQISATKEALARQLFNTTLEGLTAPAH